MSLLSHVSPKLAEGIENPGTQSANLCRFDWLYGSAKTLSISVLSSLAVVMRQPVETGVVGRYVSQLIEHQPVQTFESVG